MSVRELILTDSASYAVALDNANVYRALVVGSAQDAVTRTAPLRPLRVRSSHPGVTAKVIDNSLVCLAGDTARVLPALGLASDTLDMTISAEGYRDTTVLVPIPANAVFPIRLTAPLLLDPLPGRVRGRIMTNTATPSPIANALVTIIDPTVPLPEHVIVLREPLHFMHLAATNLRARALTSTGTLKHLVYASSVENPALVLDERVGLVPNTVLQVGSGEVIEYAAIGALDPLPATPNLPGQVTLRHPLARSFPAGTPVTVVTPGAIGATANLSRLAIAGDALLILASALAAGTIEIADALAARIEYHAVGARSDAYGYYNLDGVGHVVNIQLHADTGAANATQNVRLDYFQGQTIADFAL